MHARLIHIERNREETLGVLLIDNAYQCMTLELPWRSNKPNVSRIPTGTYACRRVTSPNHGVTFEICDVPGRTHILFHVANFVDDIEGCIAIGERIGVLGGKRAVLQSTTAFDALMKRLDGINCFPLTIENL